ncbi:MAG: FG-GAP-like repeat-containing protein, partial [Candidatus Eiseniibacteriota bacterium]
ASIDFNSIGERFVKNPDGGAIGYLGTSRFAFVNASRDIQEDWYALVFEDSVRALGEAATLSRLPLIAASEFDNAFRWTQFALTLLGDPECDLHTNMPVAIDVAHPSTYELGSGPLAVTVTHAGSPVDAASVTAWQEGEFYATATTDAGGVAELSIPAAVAGACSLTVDHPNAVPYLGTVTLTAASGAYASIQEVVIDDDASGASAGDGDGLVDAGETVELEVTVRNTGGAGLSGATGTLSIDDPGGHVALLVDTVSYGAIPSGGSVAGADAFVVDVSPEAPVALQPVVTLTLTASEGTFTDVFVLPIRRAHVEHHAHTVDDAVPRGNGNGLIEAGETIWYTIDDRNTGQETAYQVSATLRVLRASDLQPEPLVTVTDDQSAFGDIAAGSTVTGDRFEFALDPGLDPSTIRLEVIHDDIYGQTWGDTLDVVPPGAPDSLRAFGQTDAITLKWRAPADPDVRGYDIYRAAAETGPFERVNTYLAEGTSIYEDPDLDALTRYYYQVVPRDSSYNAGDPSDVFFGTTTPPTMNGWPIELGQQVQSSLQVADIDGDWGYELFTASDFQYGWHSDGTEIVDGDNDPRTSGVFAIGGYHESKGFGATTALGDVDQDGEIEVANVGWFVDSLYVWDSQGQPLPGWPKWIYDDFNWPSPVMADLDLDGDLEIILWAAKGGRLFAWHHDGTEVVDGDSNPSTDGIMRRIFGVSFNYSSPAVANLDADPEPEIVFCTRLASSPDDPQGAVYVVNPDGTDVPGWPVETGDASNPSRISTSPAIADLDQDGSNEIVVASERGGGQVHVFRADGTDVPGWPIPVPAVSPLVRVGSPVIADIDGDTWLDIVFPDAHGELWVWDRNGVTLPGFPTTYMEDLGELDEATQATPTVGDIDGDGMMEIVFGDERGYVQAFNHDGSLAAGFPILLTGEVNGSPIIWDLDQDGRIEVGVACWDSNVYIWDLPGAWNPALVPWPFFRHDVRNTGYVGSRVGPIGVGEPGAPPGVLPLTARLDPPWPNPFNPRTRFAFDVPTGAGERSVQIRIFDAGGRLVRTLVDGALAPGRHESVWDGRWATGRSAATGVYFYRVTIGDFTRAGKLTLLK